MVAYSGKRKQKASKTVAKKASPKNAFFNNSIIGDMSHVWSKYRRNQQDAKQKSGGELSNRTSGKAHSLSRQDFLMQQHKYN